MGIDRLSFASALSWQKKFKGRYAALDSERVRGSLSGQPLPGTGPSKGETPSRLHFILPDTYMNLSGESVYAAASFFKIPPERVLVVHDELELALGFGSFKFSGGLGGHNGLRSMKANFGTPDFWRLRIGIGRPNHSDIAAWVLSDFTMDEMTTLEPVLDACSVALAAALLGGPERLLPEWNKKRIGQ